MKILFICNLIPHSLGAFEDLLCGIGTEFSKNGNELHLALAGEPCEDVADAFSRSNISWSLILGWDVNGVVHPWAFVMPSLRLIRKLRPDFVFIHFGNEMPTVLLRCMTWAVVPKSKWVWVQHQQICEPSSITAVISKIRFAVPFFDIFLTNYQGGYDSLCRRGVPAGKIRIIKNGIRERSNAETDGGGSVIDEFGISFDSVVFVAVGSLIERKRVDMLIDAFCKCCNRVDSAQKPHFIIVGDGPLEASLRKRADLSDYDGNIHFAGRRGDVLGIVRECDVLIHAAVAETCTYVITESMMVGMPSIVTEAGAANEQIADGLSGYVLNQYDLGGMIDRMVELAVNEERRREMGREASRRWKANYTLEISVRGYADIIEKTSAE